MVSKDERDTIGRFSVIKTAYEVELLVASMEILSRMLFGELNGQRKGLLFSFLSFICLLGRVYVGVEFDGPHILLFLGIALAFSGIAESLPPNRRRLAGVLRILGLGILLISLVLLVLVPD